jgi:deoxyribodipyrimidine photo-lyase
MDSSTGRQLDPERRSTESRDFEAGLRRKIVGQDEAVQAVVDLYQVFRAGLNSVGPGAVRGGEMAAGKKWREFLSKKITGYGELRNDPDQPGTGGLSPYLHFGHISVHQIFHDLMSGENWTEAKLSHRPDGSRQGWWGVRSPVEQFLDQAVTWREVGFNFTSHREDYDRYESHPEWAQKTLSKHARDERQFVYSLKHFSAARTHDPLWNAA